ncbi:MAG: hypothetical protein ABGY42_00230, partial [bacterium]
GPRRVLVASSESVGGHRLYVSSGLSIHPDGLVPVRPVRVDHEAPVTEVVDGAEVKRLVQEIEIEIQGSG